MNKDHTCLKSTYLGSYRGYKIPPRFRIGDDSSKICTYCTGCSCSLCLFSDDGLTDYQHVRQRSDVRETFLHELSKLETYKEVYIPKLIDAENGQHASVDFMELYKLAVGSKSTCSKFVCIPGMMCSRCICSKANRNILSEYLSQLFKLSETTKNKEDEMTNEKLKIEIVSPYVYKNPSTTLYGSVIKVTGDMSVKPYSSVLYPFWAIQSISKNDAKGLVGVYINSWESTLLFPSDINEASAYQVSFHPVYVSEDYTLAAVAAYESVDADEYIQDHINCYMARVKKYEEGLASKNINDPAYFCEITSACADGARWAKRRPNMWTVWDDCVDSLSNNPSTIRSITTDTAKSYMRFLLDNVISVASGNLGDVHKAQLLAPWRDSTILLQQLQAARELARFGLYSESKVFLRKLNPFHREWRPLHESCKYTNK